MAAEIVPDHSLNRGGGLWTSFNSRKFSTVDPMSKMLWFSESLERDLSNDVFQSKIFFRGPNLSFFGLGPWVSMVSPNWQILLSLKYDFWWHHMKGVFVSFQKILKLLILDQRNSSYGSWKSPRTIDETEGWVVVKHLSAAITLVSSIQCPGNFPLSNFRES